MIILDDFLSAYKDLKSFAETADFRDVVNPVDGVCYPYICDVIPDYVRAELLGKLNLMLGRDAENITLFMRRSPSGVNVPHMAHTDNSMGKWSLMLYMNCHEEGGTAMLEHVGTKMNRVPDTEYLLEVARRDQNDTEAWDVIDVCPMQENRACIFESDRFHCALPVGGFGSGAEARTVLTCFFS